MSVAAIRRLLFIASVLVGAIGCPQLGGGGPTCIDTPNPAACDDPTLFGLDQDGDTFTAPTLSSSCSPVCGMVQAKGRDCDDDNPEVYSVALELCDGVDNNCTGSIDDWSASGAQVWYADADGDGFGDSSMAVRACDSPWPQTAQEGGDCDDHDPARFPNSGCDEACDDGIDNDSDGLVDCEDGDCAPSCAELSCDDGIDDEGDGTIDCEDEDCWGRGGCGGSITTQVTGGDFNRWGFRYGGRLDVSRKRRRHRTSIQSGPRIQHVCLHSRCRDALRRLRHLCVATYPRGAPGFRC